MKICRFNFGGQSVSGIIEDGKVSAFDDGFRPTGRSVSIEEVEFEAPVLPSKIVCVGRNYAEHAKELGNQVPKEPLLFLKAPSAIVGPGRPILIPTLSHRVEHEAELAVVISKRCKNISDDEDTLNYILGFTCLNDVTARDLQRADVQFTRAKSFDTFCPIGPYIETELDVGDIQVQCRVNGELRQRGRTSQMAFPVEFLVRYISRQMTLNAGDVIATGTPSGVGKLEAGDTCEVEIDGLGILSNPVLSETELL